VVHRLRFYTFNIEKRVQLPSGVRKTTNNKGDKMIKVDNDSASTQGGWFFPALTLIFITLKLTEVIDWPWIWVLAPLWIPLAVAIVVFGVMFLVLMFRDK
jgi:predicted RND superfamily exporter protein